MYIAMRLTSLENQFLADYHNSEHLLIRLSVNPHNWLCELTDIQLFNKRRAQRSRLRVLPLEGECLSHFWGDFEW
ncbi:MULTISPECIES: hypothetical protein [Kamptonema]|uniref:hypothetical protein n=1 Tax=Kamptonema TaxID=1501433 RepID=UPI0001DAD47D|nr:MULTISPECIES: hypothetical protein [Kamptonema]CBN55263.1 hypothetical protein OSCI_1610008 [Kamptonema sp. PCC 6506]